MATTPTYQDSQSTDRLTLWAMWCLPGRRRSVEMAATASAHTVAGLVPTMAAWRSGCIESAGAYIGYPAIRSVPDGPALT